ncbi:14339_t:CDS:2, partial [Entrophospora sp. SA101]
KDNLDKDNGNKNYPLWSCGDHVSKFEEEPRDWSQSGWTFYSSESRCKKKLGTNQCKKCGTQVRPKMNGYKKIKSLEFSCKFIKLVRSHESWFFSI